MELFLIVLLLLATIGISNFVNHFVPFIPVPLFQIALGVLLVVLPLGINVPMETELFMVLFIAPLLFNDGRNVSRVALWKLRKPILLLALGLVFVTVFAIGYLIHWLIPTIPLPAAFALAAILSPTDVVAVGAISSRVNIPKNVMHVLEGEGLMNDASGLVAFNFAVAATVTGVFSLADASLSFLVIAIGGFVGGAVLAFLIIRLRVYIRHLGMEDVTIHMLIQILTPFVIFLIIEHFHLSGILAVVAAGIVHAIERDREESPTMQLQVVSKSTWTVILYILNGLVFVLLGLQIPSVANEIFEDPVFNNLKAVTYVLIITAALLLLRFVWVYVAWTIGSKFKEQQLGKPNHRAMGITTISGVRGAVTLAGTFSIPFVIADGSPFPERSLIIFIAAGVILVTLVLASIFLPILAQAEKEKVNNDREEMERKALIQIQVSAIHSIRELMNEDNREAALSVISTYNNTVNQLKYKGIEVASFNLKEVEDEIRLKALEAESQLIEKWVKEKRVDRETAYLSQEYIHRKEIAVTNRMKYRFLVMRTSFNRILLRIKQSFVSNKEELRNERSTQKKKLLQIKTNMAAAAILELKKGVTPDNKTISFIVIGEYNELIKKLKLAKNVKSSKVMTRLERMLQDKAFQAERDELQNLYEKGQITMDITRKIRKQINIREAYWMEESNLQV
jgi:monovalent cation/hydrogen antiporter